MLVPGLRIMDELRRGRSKLSDLTFVGDVGWVWAPVWNAFGGREENCGCSDTATTEGFVCIEAIGEPGCVA